MEFICELILPHYSGAVVGPMAGNSASWVRVSGPGPWRCTVAVMQLPGRGPRVSESLRGAPPKPPSAIFLGYGSQPWGVIGDGEPLSISESDSGLRGLTSTKFWNKNFFPPPEQQPGIRTPTPWDQRQECWPLTQNGLDDRWVIKVYVMKIRPYEKEYLPAQCNICILM